MLKKRRSIIPNLFTMGNMLMGFFAIIFASKGDVDSLTVSAFLILGGSIFDGLDGAVARALNVESSIGLQLDSLADGISYGIAPGVITYQAFFLNLPELCCGINIGMLIAPVFPVCAIYRLARFNVDEEEHDGFMGLPTPPAGAIVASLAAIIPSSTISFYGNVNFSLPVWAIVLFYIFIALLMVSNVDYSKFFSDQYRKNKFKSCIIIVFLFSLFFIFWMWAVFVITGLYIILGIIKYTARLFLKNA